MGRNKKDTINSEASDIVMGVRIPIEFAQKFDAYVDKRNSTRSAEIQRAMKFIINSVECQKCGTINDGDSISCSHCNTLLSPNELLYVCLLERFEKLLKEIRLAADNLEKMTDYRERIDWLISREEVNTQKVMRGQLQKYFIKLDEYSLEINKLNEYVSSSNLRPLESVYELTNYLKENYGDELANVENWSDAYLVLTTLSKLKSQVKNYYDIDGLGLFTYNFQEALEREISKAELEVNKVKELIAISAELLNLIDLTIAHQSSSK